MSDKQWNQIVAKASTDAGFRRRLQSDPAAVLKENGVTVPAGVTIKVVENTDKLMHLVLPVTDELAEAELEKVAGGVAAMVDHRGGPGGRAT